MGAGQTVWLTGLPSSGKSTIAAAVEAALPGQVRVLDGDAVRAQFFPELDFSPRARSENVRRTGRLARMFAEHGVTVLVPVIAPYRADRAWVRGWHRDGALPFREVWVDAPPAVCAVRDVKGLYARARRGEITGLTGHDAPYEPPDPPDLHLRTDSTPLDACVARVLTLIGLGAVAPGA